MDGGKIVCMILNTICPGFLVTLNGSNIFILVFLYTDPGSGALIWQLLLASIFGGMFYARTLIRKVVVTVFGKQSKTHKDGKSDLKQTSSSIPNQDQLP